jgi:hypothetical protein
MTPIIGHAGAAGDHIPAGRVRHWYKTDDGVMPNSWAGNITEFARTTRFDAEACEIAWRRKAPDAQMKRGCRGFPSPATS